ncbi:hypothetical protein IRP62_11710 (plasmid) [Clostridium botulinum]|nr:hypothetical protein [Clostridium botulinum]QPW54269.1 hypothetical protein IRP62_11710 [Clostridium botulinum]
MATVNIDIGKGRLLVNKNKDFEFSFKIDKPITEDSDTWYKEYIYSSKESIENGYESFIDFNLDDYIRVDSFDEDMDDELKVNGLIKLGYKYKVDFINTNGSVLQTVKDYQDKFIYIAINETITIPISLITTSVNSYKVKVSVVTENEKEFSNEKEVILYNEKPTIIATIDAGKLHYKIDDSEGDLIKYQIKLNGRRIYPADEEYTAFQKPLSNNLLIKSTDMIVNKLNTIIINVQDNWGETNQFIYTFMGEYTGLLFVDDKNKYYSNNVGDILEKLDFGKILAGTRSYMKYIYIYNNCGQDIKDLSVCINKSNFPKELIIHYGFDLENIMDDREQLHKKLLKDKEKVKLYIQVELGLEFKYSDFTFEIDTQATPVNE